MDLFSPVHGLPSIRAHVTQARIIIGKTRLVRIASLQRLEDERTEQVARSAPISNSARAPAPCRSSIPS